MNAYKYKVSIIMAVYNVELFLREAIDSVIAQDIGFENIQLILVDDGSPDGSGAICDEYAEKYPENIVVIHKENGGVSSARNMGLEHVEGQYVNVLDSDDKLTPETVRLVCDFFAAHEEEVDLVAIPLVFFDAQTGEHPLNIKFKKGTRVIDLQKEWSLPQLSFSSSFVKADCVKNLRFDMRLAFAEDAQLVAKILSDKQKMGVVAEAKYLYRKRSVGEASAIQSSGKTKPWFLPCLEHFNEHTITYYKEKCGYVPKFAQFIVMYDLQWKFRQGHLPEGVLSEEETQEYKSRLFALLAEIDDDVILEQRSLSVEQKIYLLQKKYPEQKPQAVYSYCDSQMLFYFNGSVVFRFEKFQTKINFINVAGGEIIVEGSYVVPTAAFGVPRLYGQVGPNRYPAQPGRINQTGFCVEEPTYELKSFRLVVPVTRDKALLEFVLVYDNFEIQLKNFFFGKFCPLTKKLKKSYFYKDGILLTPANTGLTIEKADKRRACQAENALISEIWKRKDRPAKKAAVSRMLVRILRPFVPENIWLIADKADRADDNGEAFFLFCLSKKKEAGCYPVFAISKDSPDYKRLKKLGPVISYMSWKHKLCQLLAKHTISAYSHNEISSPFFEYTYYYSNLLQDNKVVFLQHGLTKDDVSPALNRNVKNYSMVVTSAQREYDSMLFYDYGYDEKQIVLTGMPRYDRLYDNNQKKITIMPTWRRKLFGTYNPQTSQWTLLPGFEESDFYRFYSDLLNSEKLHQAAQKSGYQIQFLIHPTLFAYLDRFHIDPRVKILKADAVYRDVFAESALILTDYSSVAFDFGYLRKPVLYAHFDTNHYDEGYFNYERDGFGEVEYDLDATIDRIVEYMENGCQLKEEYRRRIDGFFAFDDKNNCQRVYEKIMEMDN